jgi:HD-GYP domain-containing protein (c-di-GMP phosphodiesterase class II)
MRNKSADKTKNKHLHELPPVLEEMGGHGGPVLGWSSLEDINDTDAAWPNMVNRVAACACRKNTDDEIFHQIGEELGKMGISSVFMTRETENESLHISNVNVSSDGVAVYPSRTQQGGKKPFSLSDSEIFTRIFSLGNVVLTTSPDESLKRLFPEPSTDSTASTEQPSYVCVPLSNATGIFGVLVAAAPKLTRYKAHNIALLAHIASISRHNSRMTRDLDSMKEKMECLDKGFDSAVNALDKSMQDVVHALTAPMAMRDPYTSGHQIRVTRLAVGIAEEMGLPQYRIDGLKLAASIHDIGKIVIPFEILNRPTRLSEAEFTLIKTHPQVAFDMLSPISFRWPVAEIVLQHHEKCDGSGYPRGLHASQILQEAKILVVADVVEAMSSHRPYRVSLGIDAALDEISSKSGVLYDAEVVAACIRLLLIKNFSLEGGNMASPWQSANPFTPVKVAQSYPCPPDSPYSGA